MLAGILISGTMPNLEPRLGDFTPTAARIWKAACDLAATGADVNPVNVWRRDKSLDPVELCEIVSALPVDLPAKHVDLMVLAFEGEIRRSREVA